MIRLAKEGLLGSLNKISMRTCESCQLRKAHRNFGKALSATYLSDLIHSDIFRSMNVKAYHDASYTLIDDYLRNSYFFSSSF